MGIRALIIDDEANNRQVLHALLQEISGVQVIGMAGNAAEARAMIALDKPELVFLDINMPGETGFQLLDSIANRDFEVVFVTAYGEYGIKALKASAADYLLKPVAIDQLEAAITKVQAIITAKNTNVVAQQKSIIENLLNNLRPNGESLKIAIPHVGGVAFVDINEICYLQADSNYTILHKTNMQKIVVSKTLKDFEDILDDKGFMRIHKSSIINLKHVVEFRTSEGAIVRMLDGGEVAISRRMQDDFLKKMQQHSVGFKK